MKTDAHTFWSNDGQKTETRIRSFNAEKGEAVQVGILTIDWEELAHAGISAGAYAKVAQAMRNLEQALNAPE